MLENAKNEQELKEKLETKKNELKGKVSELLKLLTSQTISHKIEWKESSEEEKFFFEKEKLVFKFGISKNDKNEKIYAIKVFESQTLKRQMSIKIEERDGSLFQDAANLYSTINQSRLQDEVNAVDIFLKKMK